MEIRRAVSENIWRIEGENARQAEDLLIAEREVCLVAGGKECARTVMTPGQEGLWALGYLRCLGVIRERGDVTRLEVGAGGTVVEVSLREARFGDELADGRLGETAGARLCPAAAVRAISAVAGGIRWLAEAPLYRGTGAAHVAALICLDGERLVRTEDVGRHNAVDKAVGWAVEKGIDPSGVILLTSGRLPEDMVAKCAAAGIPVMASVSAATAEGAALARRCGMVLIGFVRGERMNVYAGYPAVNDANSSRVL